MLNIITGLLGRFVEPSSWAGIAAILAASLSVPVESPLIKSVTLVGAGIAGILAFILKEKSKDTTNGG